MAYATHISVTRLPESLTQVTRLFKHIRYGLSELDTLARELDVAEKEMKTFLTTYYARVLPLTSRLERLRYRKQYGVFPKPRALLDISEKQNLLEARRKTLFRKLVKRCHPDSAAKAPVSVDEVYEARKLSTLWLLEIRCQSDLIDDNDALVTYLEKERAEIRHYMQQARAELQLLKGSDLWLLKERVYDAALSGLDLVEQIQRKIENEIAALQQYFVKPREFQAAA